MSVDKRSPWARRNVARSASGVSGDFGTTGSSAGVTWANSRAATADATASRGRRVIAGLGRGWGGPGIVTAASGRGNRPHISSLLVPRLCLGTQVCEALPRAP